MSDALLTEISKKLSDIHAALKGGGAGAGAAVPGSKQPAGPDPKAAAVAKAAADAKAKAAADVKAKADAAAAAAAAVKAPKPAGPAAGTKAPGGKHTVEEVREKIREVATNASLGRQSATDILDADGGGVKTVKDLKPENYDKVYEACQVAIQTEGSPPATVAAPEDDLM